MQTNKQIDGLIIITGASSGIGEATAYRLAKKKLFPLFILGQNEQRLSRVADKCFREGAPHVISSVGNFNDRDFIQNIIDKSKANGPIKALVNCAGLGYFGPTVNFKDSKWDEIISINLTATFLLCRGIGALMIEQDHKGTIINISSDADTVGFSEAVSYCASKGGVLALTRSLQQEVQQYGIRASVISPGRVDTCFNKKKPGMRPGALSADEVAEVVEFAISCSPNIELREIRLDSLSRLPDH